MVPQVQETGPWQAGRDDTPGQETGSRGGVIPQVRRWAHGGDGAGGRLAHSQPLSQQRRPQVEQLQADRQAKGGQSVATGKFRFIFEDVGRLWRVIGSDFCL